MKKLIIHYEGNINEAIAKVKKVVKVGRISKNKTQFCWVITFTDDYVVYSDRTQSGTDVFRVFKKGK